MDYSPLGSSVHGISQAWTGADCHFLLQGIFSTQRLNLHLLYWQADSLPLSHQARFVIASLLISWLQSLSSVILEPKKNLIRHCFHFFHLYLAWSDGTECHDLTFLNVEFQTSFFTLLFHIIKRLFSSSSLSAIRVVSTVYLRLLIFLPAVLIPACDSSTPAFHMMYSAYKLNKQGDNIQPCHTPFPILNQSVPCLVLTVAS